MRVLEIRRHSIRVKPDPHLSQEGVTLARRVGETMGAFDYVATSPEPRAFETAIAMGFAVHEQLEELLPDYLGDVGPEVDFAAGFAGWAKAAQKGKRTAKFARRIVKLLRSVADELPQNGRALLIGHEGLMESAAAGCFPDLDTASWGSGCRFCEGVRITHDGQRFVDAEALRVET